MNSALLRKAVPGEESALHEAHMRSIREVCVKDHGEDEIKGWGNRPLGNRWIEAIQKDIVWVIEDGGKIFGVSFLKLVDEQTAFLHALYLTPEIIGQGWGKLLMKKLIQEAKAKAVRKIKLESTITAFEFYKSFGFVVTGPKQMVEIGGYPVTSFPMELSVE